MSHGHLTNGCAFKTIVLGLVLFAVVVVVGITAAVIGLAAWLLWASVSGAIEIGVCSFALILAAFIMLYAYSIRRGG